MATAGIAAERFRVGKRSELGSCTVRDLGRSEYFWVYPTFTDVQELHGHERGSWYFRRLGDNGNRPASIPYPTFEAALQGLEDNQHFKDLSSEQASRTPRPH